jgi:predicted nucleotidyltransferase
MSLSQLRDGLNLHVEISSFLDELLRRKAATKEVGTGPRNSRLDEFIEHEMELARSSAGPTPTTPAPLVDEANALFAN